MVLFQPLIGEACVFIEDFPDVAQTVASVEPHTVVLGTVALGKE